MGRVRIAAVWTLLALAFVAFPLEAHAVSPERKVVKRINAIRAKHHLRRLRMSRSLDGSSRSYGRWIIGHDYFGHQSHVRASRSFHLIGEILGRTGGRRPRVRAVVRSWMQSGIHRSIILMSNFRFVGVGRAFGRLGGRRTTVWVVQFGRR